MAHFIAPGSLDLSCTALAGERPLQLVPLCLWHAQHLLKEIRKCDQTCEGRVGEKATPRQNPIATHVGSNQFALNTHGANPLANLVGGGLQKIYI